MTASASQADRQPVSVPSDQSCRHAIPGSEARVEIGLAQHDRVAGSGELSVTVRCGTCDQRLFDIREIRNSIHLVADERVSIERKCPKCHSLNAVHVTKHDGRPLPFAESVSGPWYCVNCSQSLGKIDATRGRLFVTCRRCKREARVIAGNAVAVCHDEFNFVPCH